MKDKVFDFQKLTKMTKSNRKHVNKLQLKGKRRKLDKKNRVKEQKQLLIRQEIVTVLTLNMYGLKLLFINDKDQNFLPILSLNNLVQMDYAHDKKI